MDQPAERTARAAAKSPETSLVRTHIDWIAISVGGGAGFLSAALLAVLAWAALAAFRVSEPVTAAIVVGVLGGLLIGGFVAGRLSHRSVFHGSLTAVLAGTAITILALGEGSTASPLILGGFISGSAVIGGVGGWLAGRRKQSRPDERSPEVT